MECIKWARIRCLLISNTITWILTHEKYEKYRKRNRAVIAK
jgi:hypothetical protein